ncbi:MULTISPECIES: tetratricopeptide repeat protein [Bradyrhizobium]|jgi:pentatricopeptide repeat protein|nr:MULTISPECIES: tetratricopeptide repeat protein [Bradyrhizobium]MDU0954266.1 tetratricopeptide repeat protein [Bradyrhizobium sp.]MDU1491002.1 tetratricopeptide repeat protein [Bradyrhizobium sp.]MDU1541180.1 tetratricopeptide repeat protein [Bradyrhizobium sp.]MDU1688767.1 tetratricopeptide repeat protein [Bradyrhizobium sp.]MDU1806744.1 tetratricopeptide repeat protein [Bradyrhizobium sp.]
MVCVGSKRYLGRIVAAALITMLAGCGSPEKRSQDYYERGMALLEKNDDLNARVALSTSLKFNSNRLDALRALAGIDERLKDTGALFQVLRRIVELDPKDFDARLRLAKILFANNGNDAALKLLDAATAEDKGRADYHALRAAVLFKAGDLAGAVRDAEQTIRLEPGNFDALMVLASAQVARGDVDAALQMISQLPSASQDDTRVLALKVAIYGRKRDLVQTEATLKKLVDSKPEFREQLVNLYVEQRRLDEAEKELRTAAADSSADVATNLRLVRFLASFRSPAAAQEQLESRIKAGGDVFPYQMSLADLDYLQGNLDQATSLLESVVKTAAPDRALAAKNRLAQVYIRRGNTEMANKLVSEVLEKDRRNTGALKLRAAMRLDAGQVDGAIADLREALNNEPKSPELLLMFGAAFERSGKAELAARQYADAAKFSNFAPPFVLPYAAFLQGVPDLAQAETVLLESIARNPRSLPLLQALAQVRIARKNWTGALAVADVIRGAEDSAGIADQVRAAALAGQNKLEASVASLEEAHAAAPDAVRPATLLVAAYLRSGRPEKAEALLTDMLKRRPDESALLLLMGQTQSAKGRTDEAKTIFKRVITQQPKNEAAYRSLSELYANEKSFNEAASILKEGLKENPDNLNLRLSQASLSLARGDNDGAIAAYEAVLKDDPNALLAVNNLASLLLDERTDRASLDRAVQLAERLKSSDLPQFQDTYAWAQVKRGNTAEAVKLLESVIARVPSFSAARYHLAQGYLAMGRAAQANEQLKLALGAEPDGTPLKDKIRAAIR